MSGQTKRQQLQMVWPEDRLDAPPDWPAPPGYTLRTSRPEDAAAHARLLVEAGLGSWDAARSARLMDAALPQGLFFAVCDRDGAIAATAVAQRDALPNHPQGGELGWVAASNAHRGKGLGGCVSAAATRRFLEAGCRDIFLRTDDGRLPAIKTYLKIGYLPFLFAPDMEERWQAVCRELGLDFDALGAIRKTQA